jgi:polyhydroxybutyrate depolymerase
VKRIFWPRLAVAAVLTLTISTANAGNALAELYAGLTRTIGVVTAAVAYPVLNVLAGVTVLLPAGAQRALIRIQGEYLVLEAGTAAFDLTFEHNGNSRLVIVMRPEHAVAGAPMLLLLHGQGGMPQNMANITQVAAEVAQRGYWVFLPAAVNGLWNDNPDTSDGTKDDVGFIARVIDIAVSEYGVDASRVYAAGISNGAFMSERLGCELSDRIAAIGIVSATIRDGLAAQCQPAQPPPFTMIVGTADPFVLYGGSGNKLSADDTLAFWASLHGCQSGAGIEEDLPDIARDATTVQRTLHRVCSSGKEVQRYTVDGGGHAWPGGWQYLPVPLIGQTSHDIDATTVLLDFFDRWTR